MTRAISIGTRGSKLALEQTDRVMAALRAIDSSIQCTVKVISSTGDDSPDAPLQSLGIGVFTSSLERALLDQRIDLAVHSLKDLPTETTAGLTVVPVLEREDARDVLVSRLGKELLDLAPGSRIGTSSPRRVAQLKHGRPDVLFIPIRGNIETRLNKAAGPDYDGTILAAAGLRRLGLEKHITEYLSPQVCTPAPGQAAIAAEARSDDAEILALVRAISHAPTAIAVEAERSLLRAAGGGCQLPIGAHATLVGDEIRLFATVTKVDGSATYRVEVTGHADEPEIAGKAAYAELLAQGAGNLLHGVTHDL
jgi:hydroxymethylbilane synthase